MSSKLGSYSKDGSEFCYKWNGVTEWYAPTVTIAFTRHEGIPFVLHKHGREDMIMRWVHEARAKYRRNGYPDIANELHSITSDNWSVEELNKMLDITGYAPKVVQQVIQGNAQDVILMEAQRG